MPNGHIQLSDLQSWSARLEAEQYKCFCPTQELCEAFETLKDVIDATIEQWEKEK